MKKKILILIFQVFCLLPFLILIKIIFFHQKSISDTHILSLKRNNIKYILYWDRFWGYDDYLLGFGDKIFKNCSVKNCFTTKDKNLIPVEEFDAIIFHGNEYHESIANNPRKRKTTQLYIYVNFESPKNMIDLKFSQRFFNWTLTYR